MVSLSLMIVAAVVTASLFRSVWLGLGLWRPVLLPKPRPNPTTCKMQHCRRQRNPTTRLIIPTDVGRLLDNNPRRLKAMQTGTSSLTTDLGLCESPLLIFLTLDAANALTLTHDSIELWNPLTFVAGISSIRQLKENSDSGHVMRSSTNEDHHCGVNAGTTATRKPLTDWKRPLRRPSHVCLQTARCSDSK